MYFIADFPRVFQQNKRIVNGFDTEKALPYQLSILLKGSLLSNYKDQHLCGATLLTSTFAISALHCFILLDESNGPWEVIPLHNFRIVAGRYNQRRSSYNHGERVGREYLTEGGTYPKLPSKPKIFFNYN